MSYLAIKQNSLFSWVPLLFLALIIGRQAFTFSPSRFEDPKVCKTCHETIYNEWNGSMMSYSVESPVFQAFELTVRQLTGKFGPHDEENPTFCINCHSPIASYQNEMIGLLKNEPSNTLMSDLGKKGVSCTMCHSIKGPALKEHLEKGLLGNSLSNADFIFYPNQKWVGPNRGNPQKNSYHQKGFWTQKKSTDYLTSSKLCGSCHNVNLPNVHNAFTEEPFLEEQSTFSEWEASVYSKKNNIHGKEVSCNDCHMSLYGSLDPSTSELYPPGIYPKDEVGDGGPVRKHAIHRFTAASVSLLDEPEKFPNQDNSTKDRFGMPQGQKQLREQLLKMACTLEARWEKNKEGKYLLSVEIENTGAGHNVPTGLSEERQLWLEVLVRNSSGEIVFQSGTLQDSPHRETKERVADGLVDDESLQNITYKIDSKTLERLPSKMGSDFTLRPFSDGGLAYFGNAFIRKNSLGSYDSVDFFSLANGVDSSRSLKPFVPYKIKYDTSGLYDSRDKKCEEVFNTTVRLRYRSFKPRLLRALSQRDPNILKEEHIDRNEIVTMKEVVVPLEACLTKEFPANRVNIKDQIYEFDTKTDHWKAYYQPHYLDKAHLLCEKQACRLANREEYERLGYEKYVPVPGDNHDELNRYRWSADKDGSRVWLNHLIKGSKKIRHDQNSLDQYPFFCVCPKSQSESNE